MLITSPHVSSGVCVKYNFPTFEIKRYAPLIVELNCFYFPFSLSPSRTSLDTCTIEKGDVRECAIVIDVDDDCLEHCEIM